MKSNELTKQITKENFSVESNATAETAKAKFCEVWPPTRMGLEILRDIVKNPLVKMVITTVIGAGDAVSKILGCPTN